MNGKFISIHDRFLNLAESSQWPELTKRFGMCTFISVNESKTFFDSIICVPGSSPANYTETQLIHLLFLLNSKNLTYTITVPDDIYYRTTFRFLTGIDLIK